MKKLIFVFLCGGFLLSCNTKESAEYKQLQAEKDSLLQINAQADSELAETMSIIDEVEANFNKIKEAEKYLAIESKTKGEMNTDTKTRVNENFQMINEILTKNKETIALLNKKLKGNSAQLSGLQKTIERLNEELENSGKTIMELRDALIVRDKQIAKMTGDIKNLSGSIENMSGKIVDQESTIKQQDKELNTAYYRFGTSKELKEAKVISGGFLSSTKVLKESIDKSIFIKIDIREMKAIPVLAKKAKLLSEHPKSSYTLDKDANGQIVINIQDYKKFWSITPFLIVEVNK